MKRSSLLFSIVGGLLLAASHTLQAQDTPTGILVMAHGGGPAWDEGVLASVEPLKQRYPVEVAFGMADAYSLQEAVSNLENQGVRDIAVVRLFISGESWYDRTRQILGLEDGAPPRHSADIAGHGHHDTQHATADHGQHHQSHGGHASHAGDSMAPAEEEHTGHRMEFWRVESDARFRLSTEGLAQAEEVGDILLTRAETLSRDSANEDVLILAHGPGDDEENARWLQYMEQRASRLRDSSRFHDIKVATLREDWPEKREAAEQEIRAYVAAVNAAGRTPLVIPFRVHGFGPYADVLEGLDYVADESGLIPHPGISRWIARQAEALLSP